jgi:hypothetical protein
MMIEELRKELEALRLTPLFGSIRVPSVQRSFTLLARQENFYFIGYDKTYRDDRTIKRYYEAIKEIIPDFIFITQNQNNNIVGYYYIDDRIGLRVLYTQPLISSIKSIETVGIRNTKGIITNGFLDFGQPLKT